MKDPALEREDKRIAEETAKRRAELEANNYKIVPIHQSDKVIVEKLQEMGFKICGIVGGDVGNRKAFYFEGSKEEIEKAIAKIRKVEKLDGDPLSRDVELESGKAEIGKDGQFVWKEKPKEKIDKRREKTPEERAAWGQKMKEARERKKLVKV